MRHRAIYDTGFDEDEQSGSTAETCPECDGVVRTNSRETVCEDCGLIIDEQVIDHGPEWRTFDDDGTRDRVRTGAPLTERRHDRGLSTEIGRKRDGRGNTLSGRKRRQLSRLRREHGRAQQASTAERNLAHGLGEVRRIAGTMDLTDSVVEQACALFRRAQGEDLLVGRSVEAMAAACVYATCRCNGLPRSRGEVANQARVARSRVVAAYKTLNQTLPLPAAPVPPAAYVPSVASTVGLSAGTERLGTFIAEQAHERGLSNGKHPAGVAAGALYLAAEERVEGVTQQALAEAADVTALTVRSRWVALSKTIDCDVV
ncbi:transcription initiation factor IIB family protein [Halomarina salina]|uniref:Transcription initiation factor IIB n=1 Tax=Halomarina salina TaxID=1872699 RepID=A0ABD5RLF6_9EURY|nr:TFIIB-type zinc ribbon-containing protein [Halomarina salina]